MSISSDLFTLPKNILEKRRISNWTRSSRNGRAKKYLFETQQDALQHFITRVKVCCKSLHCLLYNFNQMQVLGPQRWQRTSFVVEDGDLPLFLLLLFDVEVLLLGILQLTGETLYLVLVLGGLRFVHVQLWCQALRATTNSNGWKVVTNQWQKC